MPVDPTTAVTVATFLWKGYKAINEQGFSDEIDLGAGNHSEPAGVLVAEGQHHTDSGGATPSPVHGQLRQGDPAPRGPATEAHDRC